MSDGWVCLLYHDVVHGRPRADGSRQHFSVSSQTFQHHLKVIEESGLHGCSISEALMQSGHGCVGISFDDGDLGVYEHAFPALLDMRMTATVFVTTSWVGRQGFVTWDNLLEMKAAGMSIQSHTHTHPFLSELGADELAHELRVSKKTLDAALDQDTVELALPGGDKPQHSLKHVLSHCGYTTIATSRWGRNPAAAERSYPRHIRRCTIRGEPPIANFRCVLSGDPLMTARRKTREALLGGIRSVLGPSRYATLRRGLLKKTVALTSDSRNVS